MRRFVLIFTVLTFTTAEIIKTRPKRDSNQRKGETDRRLNYVMKDGFPVWGAYISDTVKSDPYNNGLEIPDLYDDGFEAPDLYGNGALVSDGSKFREEITCELTSTPPSPTSKCCGVDALNNDRIVGGNRTKIEHHPWLVQIEYHDKNKNELKRLCGGFLISARYVLSAAHCFSGDIVRENTAVNIILGEYNTTNKGRDCVRNQNGGKSCTDGAIKVPIRKYRTHPKYVFNNIVSFNDIAIVKLNRNVNFTKYIRPICLPTSDVTVAPPANLRFITAGWGSTSVTLQHEYDVVKRHVDVPFLNNDKCREQYSFINRNHICAGGVRGKDSCKGDSGGPLIHQKDGICEAVGIVSTGRTPCGAEGRVAIYTNVYQYTRWIRQMIRVLDSK